MTSHYTDLILFKINKSVTKSLVVCKMADFAQKIGSI